MPAHRRGRQLQLGRDRGRGARALLHQQPGDGGAGAALGVACLGTAAGTGVGARAPAHGGRVQDGTGPLLFTTPVLPISGVIGKADPPRCGRPGERAHCRTRSLPCGHVAGRVGHPAAGHPCACRSGAPEAGPSTIRDPARIPRRLGLTGALLMGIGALGAGALPVPNPLFGLRVISLPARNATAAIAITYAGMGMLVLAWLWIGRMLRARGAVAPAPDRTQLARTGLLWALPLALAPPMFSKDVYSYLAQSAITARGLDPYSLGPAAALGVDDPLTRTIPTIWRDTPAPYGPLFLMLGRGITALTGSDVIQGVFAHRSSRSCGVALIIWALPRLARRCDLDAGLVLWLGAANPLVLFHLVSGIHNEGLMIGLMLAGVELALRALDRGARRAVPARSAVPARRGGRRAGRRGQAAGDPGAGVRRDGGGAPARRAGAGRRGGRGGVGRGRGRGVRRARRRQRAGLRLDAHAGHGERHPQLDVAGDGPRAALGPGRDPRRARRPHRHGADDHPRARRARSPRLLCLRLLLLVLRGRLDPVTGLGVGLGAVVLLGPVVHPWYLLWAAIPLAATRGMPRHRRAALAASALLAVMLPPDGRRLRVPVVPAAAGDPRRDRHPRGRAAGRAAGAARGRAVRPRERSWTTSSPPSSAASAERPSTPSAPRASAGGRPRCTRPDVAGPPSPTGAPGSDLTNH